MLKKLFAKLMGKKEKKRPAPKSSRRKTSPAKKKPAVKKKPAAKPARPAAKKKKPAAKKTSSKKSAAAPPPGKEIGRIIAFFRIPVVAVIKVRQGPLKIGDRLWIKGHTTNLKQTLTSMQINHQPIQEAKKGDEVGIKTTSRARRGDRVYQISN